MIGITLDELAQVTGTMLSPESGARKVLQASTMLGGLLPTLEAAHQGVMKALPKPADPRLVALSQEAMGVDLVHDALVSGLHSFLGALSSLSDEGARYAKLQGELFPEGVAGAAQATYEGQAGYAKRFRARLTPALEAELSEIPAGSKNLLQLVGDWLDAGDRLGQLGQEQRQLKAATAPPSASAVHEARLTWIRALNALRHLAPLAQLSEADAQQVFSTLNEVEAKADQRSARRRASKLEASIEADVA
jgi:hypothetical protein